MPLYEFKCEKCQHRFEKIQKFSDPDPETCPSCGGGSVRKLPSSPAIQFKGTGWYVTDYAKKSSTEGEKPGTSDKGESGTSAKPDSGSSEKTGSGTSSSADSSSASTPTTAKPETTKPKTPKSE